MRRYIDEERDSVCVSERDIETFCVRETETEMQKKKKKNKRNYKFGYKNASITWCSIKPFR